MIRYSVYLTNLFKNKMCADVIWEHPKHVNKMAPYWAQIMCQIIDMTSYTTELSALVTDVDL